MITGLDDDSFGKICALLSAITWATAVPLLRYGGNGMSPIVACAIRGLVGAVFVTLTALLSGIPIGQLFEGVSIERHLLLILSAFLGISLADTFFFLAARRLQIGVIGLTQTLFSPLTVTLAAIFLGERITGWQLLGGVLVVSSIVVVKLGERKEGVIDKLGLFYAFACIVTNVVGVLLVKVSIGELDVLTVAPYRMIVGTVPLVLWIFLKQGGSERAELSNRTLWIRLIPGTFMGGALSTTFWLASFVYTKASIAGLILESSSLFLLLIGWLLYKEKPTKEKQVAALLAAVGLGILWL